MNLDKLHWPAVTLLLGVIASVVALAYAPPDAARTALSILAPLATVVGLIVRGFFKDDPPKNPSIRPTGDTGTSP